VLVAKGTRVELELEGGGVVRPHGSMLHDESGADWPYGSVLFCPYKKGGGDIDKAEGNQSAIDYFGYTPRAGKLNLPDYESIDDWDYVGVVESILYFRPGDLPAQSNNFFDFLSIWRRPRENYRGEYEHTFKRGWLVFGSDRPRLFRLGSCYRMEMPPWSVVNWRGFVSP
jgi:hypothetical protein